MDLSMWVCIIYNNSNIRNTKCKNGHKEVQTEKRNTKKNKNHKYMKHTFMEYNKHKRNTAYKDT